MRRFFSLISVLVSFLLVSACSFDSEEDKIISAAQDYARQQSNVQVELQVAEVEDNYARVKVTPVNPEEADDAVMYLRKDKNGNWEGLALGTAFTPDDYAAFNIPESIQE